jgi:hypothetical protein
LIGGRQLLVYTHRWLGIAGCVLFLAWFASGIVMIYARMPEFDAAERRALLPSLDFRSARLAPHDAFRDAAAVQRIRIGMFQGRPVYRALVRGRWTTIFADDGRVLEALTPEQAAAEVRRFAPDRASTIRYGAAIAEPDQWTLQSRALLPMHRVALGDADGTVLYVSDRTGEIEVKTTARDRRIAYAGAVLHWLYFTPLRRNGPLWTQTIIWLSVAGCVLCLSGLVWGFMVARRSPYTGIMRWHHYAGLMFGVFTFTWIFSGLLSMDPWDWHPPTSPTRAQRDAATGGPRALERLSLDRLRTALDAMAATGARDVEIVPFRGEPYLSAEDRLLAVGRPERGTFARFDDAAIEATARAAMPDTAVEEASWLRDYDSYYYDRRSGALPLPVLRVKFADANATWLYLDPSRGAIVRREERLSRLNRWLYHGFHSFDFPFLYARRPLWDIVMIALSAGGLASAVTSLLPAWRRVRGIARGRRHGTRDRGQGTGDSGRDKRQGLGDSGTTADPLRSRS